MSPTTRGQLTTVSSFPRVSGDEPGRDARYPGGEVFSPRERG